MKCGLVYPVWVQLGTVQWAGTPQPEKLLTIERRRCEAQATVTKEWRGLTMTLCPQHAEECFR